MSNPKPRPRPRIRRAQTQGDSKLPGSSQLTIEQEDDFFIRKRSDTAWKALKKAEQEQDMKRRSNGDDISDEGSDVESPRRKKIKKSLFGASKELPSWARGRKVIQISSDDEEDDVVILEDQTVSNVLKKEPQKVDRSPSLTPPIIDESETMSARRIVFEHLYSGNNQPSKSPEPSFLTITDDDSEGLDPELAAIKAVAVKNAAKMPRSNNNVEGKDIRLVIRLIPHPRDTLGSVRIYPFELGRTESFERVFDEVADMAGIPRSNLVIIYKNMKVYPSSTPTTIKIWSEAELEAYAEQVYCYIREQERRGRQMTPAYHTPPSSSSPSRQSQNDTGAESDTSQGKNDTFKLTLQSGSHSITVTVRPTTKCSSIVSTFVKKLNLPAAKAKNAFIEVDGEKMNPGSEIGDADLEDGDQVDIGGLGL